jgi:hypothetical protein
MNRIKTIVIGAFFGSLLGLANAILAVLGITILAGLIKVDFRRLDTLVVLLILGLGQGLILGAINGSFNQAESSKEQVFLNAILSLTIASVKVLTGGYLSHSLMPIAIYGFALANGVLIAAATIPLVHRVIGIDQQNILIG